MNEILSLVLALIAAVAVVFAGGWIIIQIIQLLRSFYADTPKQKAAARQRVLEKHPDIRESELKYLINQQLEIQRCLRCLPFIGAALGLIALYFFARFGLVGVEFSQPLKIALSVACLISMPVALVLGVLSIISLLKIIPWSFAYRRSLLNPEKEALYQEFRTSFLPDMMWVTILGLFFVTILLFTVLSLFGAFPETPTWQILLCSLIPGAFLTAFVRPYFRRLRHIRQDRFITVKAVCVSKHIEMRTTSGRANGHRESYDFGILEFTADDDLATTYTLRARGAFEHLARGKTYTLYFFSEDGKIQAICNEEDTKVLFAW